MRNLLLYILGVLGLMLFHEYVLLNIASSSYVSFYVYVLAILVLPMRQRVEFTMLTAVVIGSLMDIISGTSALCTMSLVSMAFVRRFVLQLVVPSDILLVGGLPLSHRLGGGVFLRYCFLLCLVYGGVYFSMELMSFAYFWLILLRLFLSSLLSCVLIFVFQLPLRA